MFDRPNIPVKDMIVPGLLPSRAQRAIYRRRGYRIAADVELAPGVVIEADEVSIGPGSSIGMGCVLRGRSIVIGRRVQISAFCIFEGGDFLIGDDTRVREQVFVGGPLMPDSRLELGRRVHVFHACFLNPSRPLSIGDDSCIGGRSSIFTHGSWQSILKGYPVTFEPISIGREVWLAWHSFVIPGVVIGDGATIGAGSVVNRSIPARTLAAGVPASVLRSADSWPRSIDDDRRWEICRDVTRLMSAYFGEHGAPVRLVQDAPDRLQLALGVDGQPREIEVVRDPAVARGSDLLVSMCLPAGELLRGRSTCLGLLDGRRVGQRDALSREVESFWGRYGVRFLDVDEA
ncbi:MAG TPA: acyltransferase [Solirubrobacteraceae bacterium]